MQRQLKQLDEELELNHLTRLPDPIPKPSNSLFRALSVSVFTNHNQTQYIQSIMRLTLTSNCESYLQNIVEKRKRKYLSPFPIISQTSQLTKKFTQDPQMLEAYKKTPDLQCFLNDNYELASFTFNRRVSVYSINKDGYLNETLISCCRNKTGRKIMLAKVGKRFFAVEKESSRAVAMFVRQYLVGNLINQIVLQKSQNSRQKQPKVHFINYDEIISHKKYPKIHKKSLSQCGEAMSKLQQFSSSYKMQQFGYIEENFHTNIKNKYDLVYSESYDTVSNRSHKEEPLDRKLDDFEKEESKGEGVLGDEEGKGSNSKEEQSEEPVQREIVNENKTDGQNQENEENLNDQTQKPSIDTQIHIPADQSPNQTQPPLQAMIPTQPATQQQPYPYTYEYTQQQLQQYYQQNPYLYANYPQYYSQADYANYYNVSYYDPQQYYPYYQQQAQTETFAYSQGQTFAFTQPQELIHGKRYRGKLKFYDSNGKYGFIIVDAINSDLFVHFDDLNKAGIDKQRLQSHSTNRYFSYIILRQLRFQFTYYEYEGKNKKAKKAVDLTLLPQLS